MPQVTEFLWVVIDSAGAALIGLNIVPVIIISLIAGIIQAKQSHYGRKALLCLFLALLANALWPLSFGGGILIPSLLQPEGQIQTVILYGLAYGFLRLMCVVKNSMSLKPRPRELTRDVAGQD